MPSTLSLFHDWSQTIPLRIDIKTNSVTLYLISDAPMYSQFNPVLLLFRTQIQALGYFNATIAIQFV